MVFVPEVLGSRESEGKCLRRPFLSYHMSPLPIVCSVTLLGLGPVASKSLGSNFLFPLTCIIYLFFFPLSYLSSVHMLSCSCTLFICSGFLCLCCPSFAQDFSLCQLALTSLGVLPYSVALIFVELRGKGIPRKPWRSKFSF